MGSERGSTEPMELEIGVRLTRITGDLTFASTETEAIFILAAHLPGFTKDSIEVAMNEGERKISIRGGGLIASQEAVITSSIAITREVVVESFNEAFLVPGSVDWGTIDAWFEDEEEILIISISKLKPKEPPSGIEEEEIKEPKILEGQVYEEPVQGKTQEPIVEKNGEPEHQESTKPQKVKEKTEEPQAYAGITRWPPRARELTGLPPVEQLQAGGQGVETKIAAPPQHTESKKHLQIMEAAERQPDHEREMEAAQVQKTLKGKKPMHTVEDIQTMEEENQAPDHPHKGMAAMEDEKAQDLQQEQEIIKQKAKQPTKKASLEILEVARPTKEKAARKELEQPEEKEPQEDQRPPEGPPLKKVETMKLQEPKEPDQKHAQQVESEDKEGLHEDEMKKQESLIVATTYEKPKATRLMEKQELKPDLHGLEKDEDRQQKSPDVEASRTRESIKPKKVSQDLLKEEKELKQELWQPQGHDTSDYSKPTVQIPLEKDETQSSEPQLSLQEPEKVHVKLLDQVWEAAEQIQSKEIEKLESKLHRLKEDEDHQWKSLDIEASKTREPKKPREVSQDLQKEEKEAKQELWQPQVHEPLEYMKPTVQPPHEKDEAQSLEPQLPEKKPEKFTVKLHDQIWEPAVQIQPEEIEEGSTQHEDRVQEHEKPKIARTYSKPRVAKLPEPKPEMHGLKEDDRQLKAPDIEDSKTKEIIKLIEVLLDPQQKQRGTAAAGKSRRSGLPFLSIQRN